MEPSQSTVSLKSFSLRLTDVVLPMGLRISNVTVEGDSLRIVPKPFKAETETPGHMTALVTCEELSEFLSNQAPAGLKNFQISVLDGKLHVSAVKPMLMGIPFRAVCTLEIQDERRVYVQLESVDMMGADMKHLVSSQLEKINPVLNVDDLPLKARLKKLDLIDGAISLRGTIEP